MASTQLLRLHYRDRTYRINVAAARIEEATWELEALQIRFLGHRRNFQHGEFDAIAQAFECVYQYPNPQPETVTTRITLVYLRTRFSLSVPLCFFFHATVQLRELFLADDVRAEQLSVGEFRSRFDRCIIIGSPFLPAVFAWKRVWALPPQFPRPAWTFQELLPFLCARVWQASRATPAGFDFFWSACLAFLGAGDPFCELRYPHLGRSWSLTVAQEDALEAALVIETVVQHSATSIAEFETCWAPILQRFGRKKPLTVPPAFEFDPATACYATMPAAFEPEHGPSNFSLPSAPQALPATPPRHWCRLCHFHTNDADAFALHVDALHAGPAAYRRQCLDRFATDWPAPTSPPEVRAAIASYAERFHSSCADASSYCASCSFATPTVALASVDLRAPPFQLELLHCLLSSREYVTLHSATAPSGLPSFLGLVFEAVQSIGVRCPLLPNGVPVTTDALDTWLLYFPEHCRGAWEASAQDASAHLMLHLCQHCNQYLSANPPRLPPRALANGNLSLPLPAELRDLTVAEQAFIARGYTLTRLHTLPGRCRPEDRQTALRGNVISFPQSAGKIFASLPRPLTTASEMLTVIFARENQADFSRSAEFRVRRGHVLAALQWLQRHNPFYADLQFDMQALRALPEDGVPSNIAVEANVEQFMSEQGAADAQTAAAASPEIPVGAAVLDIEGEDVLPPDMWRQALSMDTPLPDNELTVVLPRSETPLSSTAAGYWTWCFPALFPYGDALPSTTRRTFLPRPGRACFYSDRIVLKMHFRGRWTCISLPCSSASCIVVISCKLSVPKFLHQVLLDMRVTCTKSILLTSNLWQR